MEAFNATKWKVGDLQLYMADGGSGVPLLLVHGFPLDHTMWRGQIAELAAHTHILAPDLRGFGRSDAGGDVTTMEQFADDLASLLDARGIVEPVVYCGLSMGGYIGWQFVRRHRQRLRGLILCDTRAGADAPVGAQSRLVNADRVLVEGAGFLADGMMDKLLASQTRHERPALADDVRRMMNDAPRQGVAAALRGMAARVDATAWLPEIDLPTLVLCGEHDVISPPAEMQAFAQQMPHARFVQIPAAGHLAPLEQPQAVNRAIREFLA